LTIILTITAARRCLPIFTIYSLNPDILLIMCRLVELSSQDVGLKNHGIQEGGGAIPNIFIISHEFQYHSRLLKPIVFHLKIKYSRGGISWLVSQ
jgi:hypothetical protein